MIYRYHYRIFNETQKEMYLTMFNALSTYADVISLQGFDSVSYEQIYEVFEGVLYDNPKIFYTTPSNCKIKKVANTYVLYPQYFFPLSSIIELQKWLDEVVARICEPIIESTDAFAKEIYIHNYLINNISYSKTEVAQPVNAYTVAGTLLENNSVCAGVALSFKLLMDYVDIPCVVATGHIIEPSSDSGRHAWNIVYIEDSFYHIDVTWDLLGKWKERLIDYDFFNLTSDEMRKTRTFEHSYPICLSKKYNYFVYMNAVVYTIEEMKHYITQCARKGDKTIYFKYCFIIPNMEMEFTKCLRGIRGLRSYSYWISKSMNTIIIKRS